MSKDLIIDFETLSTEPNAALLSMGLTVVDTAMFANLSFQDIFDKMVSDGVHFKLKVSNQVGSYGRIISRDTVDWWSTQKDSASAVLTPQSDDMDLSELPDAVNNYLKENGYKKGVCYTRGMIDSTWLQSVARYLKKDVNIEWWNYRDIRTFIDVMSGSTNGYLPKQYAFWPKGLIKHNALHDCALDVLQMYIAASLYNDDIPF